MAKLGSRIFYGWWIVIVSFLCMFMGIGISVYTFGVFLKPIAQEFGWSRGAFSGIHALFSLSLGMAGPLIGKLVDKYGFKWIMVSGTAGMGASLILFGLVVDSLWHAYIIYFLLGLGVAAMSGVPVAAVVSNWFSKKRGLAMGAAMVGAGLGGMSMITLAHYFLLRFGWRATYLIFGILVWLIIIPAVAFIMINKPQDVGLEPDGIKGQERKEKGNPDFYAKGIAKDAFRTSNFWILSAVFFLLGISTMGTMAHFMAFMTDRGISTALAAAVYGLMPGLSIIGKLGFGYLSDKTDKRYVAAICYGMMTLGIFSMLLALKFPAMLYFAAACFGFSLGGVFTLQPILVSHCFGLASFGEIFGFILIGWTFGCAAGPPIVGFLYDLAQSYYFGFLVIMATVFLASFLVLFIKPLKPENTFTL
ncbi:MAG: MFS transporter [Syntrophales bacterium]|nr:MFS transporter [Syntrophales bacterium]